jgi:hypothetical protein
LTGHLAVTCRRRDAELMLWYGTGATSATSVLLGLTSLFLTGCCRRKDV